MSKISSSEKCPCTSGVTYGACCQPILEGKTKAKTAEELLRARYSSFVVGNIDFIVSTHHSATQHEVNRTEIEKWSKDSEWKGLEVLQREAGLATDETGTLVFHAKYVADGKEENHYEKSTFEKEKGEWKFLDAVPLRNGPYIREEPKIGRNDPCHCGSGKKFKKCHGNAA